METNSGENQRTEHKGGMFGGNVAEKVIGAGKEAVKNLSDSPNGVKAGEREEGAITKQIEGMTSKIPSATFLSLALGSIGLSAILRMLGRNDDSQFVGQWVPTILILGLYNKLVKLEGSENLDGQRAERM